MADLTHSDRSLTPEEYDRIILEPAHRLLDLIDHAKVSRPDYADGKEWEFAATVDAFLSLKEDLEPIPMFNEKGQQVGIGVGLLWWHDQDGQLRWALSDESRECRLAHEDDAEYWPLRDTGLYDGLVDESR